MTMTFIRASAHATGLPDKSVQTIVTSPPFFGLRKYQGDQDIDWPAVEYAPMPGLDAVVSVPAMRAALGNEPTLDAYVGHLVLCLREWRRVLRDDGLVFCNLGDSYNSNASNQNSNLPRPSREGAFTKQGRSNKQIPDLLPKSLLQVPARFALAAQAEGWYLRADCIGAKVSPMPESVTDRPTRSHEHVFMLAKSARYYSDMEGVKEAIVEATAQRYKSGWNGQNDDGSNGARTGSAFAKMKAGMTIGEAMGGSGTRNMRDVFEWRPGPFAGAHFATWPEAVPERFIRMSTSPHGCCPACGAAWRRVVKKPDMSQRPTRTDGAKMNTDEVHISNNWQGTPKSAGQAYQNWRNENPDTTIGWVPTCECYKPAINEMGYGFDTGDVTFPDGNTMTTDEAKTLLQHHCERHLPPVPCVVLDPFSGSGATCKAAARIGRDAIGIDVCEQYLEDVTAARMGDGFQMELTR